MVTTKDRRHSGRRTSDWAVNGKTKYKEAIQEAIEPQPEWNDWLDYRDGQRDYQRRKNEKKN